jgi:acyl carrier protein
MSELKKVLQSFILLELANDGKRKAIGEDESLLANGIVDSIGMVKLLQFVEEKCEIKVEDEELVPENFETINALCQLIEGKRASLHG